MKKLAIALLLTSLAPAYAQDKPPLLPKAPIKVIAQDQGLLLVEDSETGCQTYVLYSGNLLSMSVNTSFPRLTAAGKPYCRDTISAK